LTHINYAFLLPDANGTFVAPEHMDQLLAVITAAHAHGVKVLISVGGWGWDEAFEAFAAQPPARAHFVRTLLEFVETYDLDGVDMDWEYPGPARGSADSYST
jgi:GH18 family chitinase